MGSGGRHHSCRVARCRATGQNPRCGAGWPCAAHFPAGGPARQGSPRCPPPPAASMSGRSLVPRHRTSVPQSTAALLVAKAAPTFAQKKGRKKPVQPPYRAVAAVALLHTYTTRPGVQKLCTSIFSKSLALHARLRSCLEG